MEKKQDEQEQKQSFLVDLTLAHKKLHGCKNTENQTKIEETHNL